MLANFPEVGEGSFVAFLFVIAIVALGHTTTPKAFFSTSIRTTKRFLILLVLHSEHWLMLVREFIDSPKSELDSAPLSSKIVADTYSFRPVTTSDLDRLSTSTLTIRITDNLDSDVADVHRRLRGLEGEQLLDCAARFLYESVYDLLFASIELGSWGLKAEYRHAAIYPHQEPSLTEDFGRCKEWLPIIDSRIGAIARSFREYENTNKDWPYGLVLSQTESDPRVCKMNYRSRAEATVRVIHCGRPVLVLNLESASENRFLDRSTWWPATQRLAKALANLIPNISKLLFCEEMRLCQDIRRDFSFLERSPEGIRDILDRAAHNVRHITDSRPEFVTISVPEPGGRSPLAFKIYGFSLASQYRSQTSLFELGMDSYIPDRYCLTARMMQSAEEARKSSRPDRAITLIDVNPEANTCVPAIYQHHQKKIAFLPVVNHDGDWLAAIYLHFFRSDVHFDEFCSLQLHMFADAIAPMICIKQRGWYRLYAEFNRVTRSQGRFFNPDFSI